MKINKQPKNTPNTRLRLAVIIAVILLIFAAAYTAIAYKNQYWPFSSTETVDTDGRQDTVNESPKNNNPATKGDTDTTGNKGLNTDEVPVAVALSASITTLEQSGDAVNFSAKINGTASNGTCVVTFSNANDRPVTKEFSSTTKDNITTCGPVSIPSLEFSFLGEWNVSLRYYTGTEQVVTEGKVTIQ